ncbi:E3 ubiquitin-protein ligase RNF14 [Galendromus occidentalis]|uniref:RBR-type E3 ubiquitin transferase n=1 Tax=Galendromus occidentalis TaxID=34638 RepID=A0AAJ6QW41_9ACAR|nr:E3 ubiquitin-protein ligase RNF14 [Galendromus occidentalis]
MASANPIPEETSASCLSSQQDELDALESIYGEKIFARTKTGNLLGAKLTFSTRLPRESVNVKLDVPQFEAQSFRVNYLPPLYLDLVFPEGYPELEPPRFVIHAQWLNMFELNKICARLDEMWKENENMIIVFNWVDFLENELLNFLGIADEIDLKKLFFFQNRSSHTRKREKTSEDSAGTSSEPDRPRDSWSRFDRRAKLIPLPVSNIVPFLKDYNVTAKREHFENTPFECTICFNRVPGKDATVFSPCGHAFCNDCTAQHIRTQMDGGLESGVVTCMEPGCDTEILGSEVKRLIGAECFERYDELLLKRYLNSEKDITTCARRSCEKPVIADPSSTVATCAECNYSFCTDCRRANHGINPCILNSEAEKATIEQYLKGDSTTRATLEKKYSKKYLKALIANDESEKWISKNSKKCPNCRTDIEKSEGCNKMVCWKCHSKFCYLCGKDLDRLKNPYDHFSVSGSLCYMRLFEGAEDGDEHDDDDGDEDDEGAHDGIIALVEFDVEQFLNDPRFRWLVP